jgi:polysaccharide export outer membrane protein
MDIFSSRAGFPRFGHCLSGLLCAVVLLAGCASGTDPADIDVGSGNGASPDYVIGPGDSLQVFVWRNAELSSSVSVRPDGQISVPLVEDIQAAGKNPMELARDIEERLTDYVRDPNVTVIVQSFVGDTTQQVRVVGQAVQPQSIQYQNGMTLLDVMISVGGLSDFAAGNRAKVVRRIDDRYEEIRVRIADLLNRGDMSQNMRMLPGDVVIVPESVF